VTRGRGGSLVLGVALIGALSGCSGELGERRAAGRAQQARVVAASDGDTLRVRSGSRVDRVRLLGIDTPETVDPSQPAKCYGQEATARTAEQLTGEQVWLQTDPSQAAVDVYGRDLAYVWLTDDLLVNLQLIADGYAREYTYDQPYLYRDAFLAAQTRAQQAHRGLWSAATCAGQ